MARVEHGQSRSQMAVKIPVRTPEAGSRAPAEVRAMALAVQANLVTLKVVEAKRRGIPSNQHEIHVPPPGFVRAFRETLIDPHVAASYSDLHLHLRIREIWGQFCMMSWLLGSTDPPERANLAEQAAEGEVRCGPAVETKHDEVHAFLWTLRFEQRRRQDPAYGRSPQFAADQQVAGRIPAQVFGKAPGDCTDEELLYGACEYAGMLSAIRWTMCRVAFWGQEGSMDVAERPF